MSLTHFGANKFVRFTAVLLCIFSAIGLILFLIEKVQPGNGTEHYLSVAGYRVSYLQALMMFGSIPVLGVIGLIIGYFAHREERDFKKKYKIKDD